MATPPPGTKLLSDGNWKVTYVPTLANFHAPTATALNAGLDVQTIVAMNNFQLGPTGENTIDDPALASRSNDQAPGKTTYEGAMEFFRYREELSDVAYETFATAGIGGFWIVRIGKAHEEPWAAGDDARVHGAITGQPRPLSPSGGFEKFMLGLYVQGEQTDLRAVVA